MILGPQRTSWIQQKEKATKNFKTLKSNNQDRKDHTSEEEETLLRYNLVLRLY